LIELGVAVPVIVQESKTVKAVPKKPELSAVKE
jgi:hypothetical protein